MSDSDNTTRIVCDLLNLLNANPSEYRHWTVSHLKKLKDDMIMLSYIFVFAISITAISSAACFFIFNYVASGWFWTGFCCTFWTSLISATCMIVSGYEAAVTFHEIEMTKMALADIAMEEI